ncbi:uncharacterized protein [Asterias amurensis]|uniref:uncharacterized protein isoform X2 n=1 Tax=Asterias amurensis TaxID=7602 RepID=UPI003AB157C3
MNSKVSTASPITPKATTTIAKGVASSPKARPGSTGASKSPSRFTSGQSMSGKFFSANSPSSKHLPIMSSPRKSIFSKAVGQSGAMKLGSGLSHNKTYFGKSSGLGQFDLPLALRKKRRPNAGMKREPDIDMDKIQHATNKPPQKDGKMPQKRKLSHSSPNSSKVNVKHKEDYVPPSSKKRKINRSNRDQDSRNDFYCWVCHKEGSVICCELCPRVYHPKCAKLEGDPYGDWFCPECARATNAECIDSQSKAMASLTLDQLAKLLLFALKRMRHSGAEPFLKPVNLQQNPGYEEFVFNPMDLSTLEKSIKKRMYGSTEAFLLDAKWILHNCIVFNGSHHKLTNSARMIIKICEYEVKEIEICPDCYLSACLKRDKWFCEVCRDPHKLVWARLQGFPFWPSKVIREKDGQLDVRFFGQHDRAWVPVSSCYMYSSEIPCHSKKKTTGLNSSVAEMELHIQNLQRTFGKDCFKYAPNRTPFGTLDCLIINPGDRQKWQGSRMAMGSFLNGMHDRSSPKPEEKASAVEIKTEPVDVESLQEENAAAEKSLEGSLNVRPESQTVLDKDTNDAVPKGKPQDKANGKSSTVSENNNSAEKDNNSGSTNSTMSSNSKYSTIISQVKRQVFTVARKRMGSANDNTSSNRTNADESDDLSRSPPPREMSPDVDQDRSDNSEASSPSKAPVGVFEVSDESLDVDPDMAAQSPSVQLLGKSHASQNEFSRSLAIKLNKVSPRSLGKMGNLRAKRGEELEEADLDGVAPLRDSKRHPEIPEESETSDDLDTPGETSKVNKSSGNKVKSASPTDEIVDNNTARSSAKGKIAESPEKLDASEDTPSTSQSTTPKDKFHIKLGKTIETMKASLGIERLHSVEKDASDSESSDSESESSEADHSEESDMEVDNNASNKINSTEKGSSKTSQPNGDNDQATQESTDSTSKDTSNKTADTNDRSSKTQASNSSVDGIVKESPHIAKPGISKKDTIKAPRTVITKRSNDSDIDLAMSCHSEMSDSDAGDLVIDETDTEQRSLNSATNKTKESGKSEQQSEAHIHDDYQAPMDMDDVILVSNPFVKKDQPDTRQTTKEVIVHEQEPHSNITDDTETPKASPSTTNPPPSDKQIRTDVTVISTSNAHPKPFIPSKDQERPPEATHSSFPSIIESLKAKKRETSETVQPQKSEPQKSEPQQSEPQQSEPQKSAESTLPQKTAVVVADKDAAKETDTDKCSNFYDKYIAKVSTAVEGVLNDFTKDMKDGMLLKDAKSEIEDLKMEVQRLKWVQEQEKTEYKQIMDLALAEMKECMEAEAAVAMENLKMKLETEKQDEIRKTKSKQWCAMCGKDAVFFCCWNTSYCDYPCQQSHWSTHRNSCQQRASGNTVIQVQQLQNKAQPPSQQVPMQLRPNIQQQINQSSNQPVHPSLHQQVQQVMQQPPASSQPMQTLIQYVQAPRMSAPLPVPQLINHHPYPMPGGRVGTGGLRIVRP